MLAWQGWSVCGVASRQGCPKCKAAQQGMNRACGSLEPAASLGLALGREKALPPRMLTEALRTDTQWAINP